MSKIPERAGILDIVLEEGTDFSTTLTWVDEAGDPVDITGYTARQKFDAANLRWFLRNAWIRNKLIMRIWKYCLTLPEEIAKLIYRLTPR